MTDEKRLLRAIRSGRKGEPEGTFQYLYTKYKPLVWFVVAKYVKSECDIEDIVQDTFISFFNHADTISSSVKAYLTATAKNLALNFLKKNAKLCYVDDDALTYLTVDASSGDHWANARFDELICDMRKVLPEEDVKIILLHLIDDVKFEDIAHSLKQNVKTVKTKYYRALKKYKKERSGGV